MATWSISMFLKPKCLSIASSIVWIIFQPTLGVAYEPVCTHPKLARRAAELYAKHYGKAFEEMLIQKMEQGATHEDNGNLIYLRSTNHFYDVHNNRPWTDFITTAAIETLRIPCFQDIRPQGYIRTAKDWALNGSFQKINWPSVVVLNLVNCSYDGDYSWPAVLSLLETGASFEQVAYAQGHLLHLIQDLTVPAHTRNDTHILPDPLEHSVAEALENYAQGHCDAIPTADTLYSTGLKPIVLDDFSKNFDEVATYTYSHYFSDHTKFSAEYDMPTAASLRRGTEMIDGKIYTYLYGMDDSSLAYGQNAEYRLVEVKTDIEKYIPIPALVYKLSDEVLGDYWQRLLRKAIAYGAGTLKKLSDEATARGKCFPSCPTMNPTPCSGKVDGPYCGSTLTGYTGNPNDLVSCSGNKVAGASSCMYGCHINPPGTNDVCNAGPCTTYYLDQDGDGHGDKVQPGKCMAGPSAPYTVTSNDDCNDADRDIYPGHTEWWDVKDNNCDGLTDNVGLVHYDRWHKEWNADDWEHRFSSGAPGGGSYTMESHWVELYPTNVCTGSYAAPGCTLSSGGIYAEVRPGVQLVALSECGGQYTARPPNRHVALYLPEDASEYRDYLIEPGFTCTRIGYALSSTAAASFPGRAAFNRLRSCFCAGGRADNMWSTQMSEVNHTGYAVGTDSRDIAHWYAPRGL